jgi:hypothetical protein
MSAAAFFGADIDRVQLCCRRRAHCATLQSQFEQRLSELGRRRDRQISQNSVRLPPQQAKLEETENRLQQARRSQAELLDRYRNLARVDGSFWRKLGLRLAGLVYRKTLRVGQIRQRLAALDRELDDGEANLDYLARVRAKQQRALDQLTGPLEELARMIDSLQQQSDANAQQASQCEREIQEAVQSVVRSTPADALIARLAGFESRTDMAAVAGRVFRLRTLLLQRDMIGGNPLAELADADPGSDGQRIRSAVEEAFVAQSSPGTGRLRLAGHGTTHVRKSRSRTESRRDAQGRLTRHPRTERYWAQVEVTLSGELPVPFDVTFHRWQSAPLAAALARQAATCFAVGVQQMRQSIWREREKTLSHQIATLTREISDVLIRCA